MRVNYSVYVPLHFRVFFVIVTIIPVVLYVFFAIAALTINSDRYGIAENLARNIVTVAPFLIGAIAALLTQRKGFNLYVYLYSVVLLFEVVFVTLLAAASYTGHEVLSLFGDSMSVAQYPYLLGAAAVAGVVIALDRHGNAAVRIPHLRTTGSAIFSGVILAAEVVACYVYMAKSIWAIVGVLVGCGVLVWYFKATVRWPSTNMRRYYLALILILTAIIGAFITLVAIFLGGGTENMGLFVGVCSGIAVIYIIACFQLRSSQKK